MSWEMVRISDFADVVTGGTPSTKNKAFWENGNLPWLNSGELNQDIICTSENYITELGLENSSARMMPPDTVLIALTGATTGVVGYLTFPACANQSVTGILPSQRHNPKFLYYYLKSIRSKVIADSYGGAQKHISQGYVKDIYVPLPPLPVQKRIAEILDAADALRRKDEELLKKYDELAQAIFIDMFGDPVRNEKGWEVTKLSEIVAAGKNKIRTGPFGSDLLHSEFVSVGIAVLGIDNVVKNVFEHGNERYITKEKYEQLRRYTVHSGDILITIMGTVGRAAVVPDDIGVAINTKHLVAITPNVEKVDSQFLCYNLTKNPTILTQLKRKSRGAIMDGLNMGLIKDLNFLLPPVELQREFSSVVNMLVRSKSKLERNHSEQLFNGLIQKAFKGEIVNESQLATL